MITLLTAPGMAPFAIALTVVGLLFALEILSALLGGSILSFGTDAPDIDIDTDFDLSIDADAAFDAAEGAEALETSEATGGLFTWMGARDVPFLIWLVSFLTMFGLSGLIIQSAISGIIGTTLPAGAASLVAIVPALAVTRVIANWVALIMPKTETTAMRARHLGGHRGTITQGTAARGRPAEVKIKDRHGNTHYLRVEPLHDDETFAKGSDVTLIRKRGDRFFVI